MSNKNQNIFIISIIVMCAFLTIFLLLGCRERNESESDVNGIQYTHTKELECAIATRNSSLHFETMVANLGKIEMGQTKEAVFGFTNVSPNPAVITRVVTSCGCTSADYPKRPIAPNKESEIKVNFKAEEEGVFFKKLLVFYAGNDSPVEIAIKGEVKR